MKPAYLKEDIKGGFSKKLYGNKNDQVYIIGRQAEMILVLGKDGNKFFVNQSKITYEKQR